MTSTTVEDVTLNPGSDLPVLSATIPDYDSYATWTYENGTAVFGTNFNVSPSTGTAVLMTDDSTTLFDISALANNTSNPLTFDVILSVRSVPDAAGTEIDFTIDYHITESPGGAPPDTTPDDLFPLLTPSEQAEAAPPSVDLQSEMSAPVSSFITKDELSLIAAGGVLGEAVNVYSEVTQEVEQSANLFSSEEASEIAQGIPARIGGGVSFAASAIGLLDSSYKLAAGAVNGDEELFVQGLAGYAENTWSLAGGAAIEAQAVSFAIELGGAISSGDAVNITNALAKGATVGAFATIGFILSDGDIKIANASASFGAQVYNFSQQIGVVLAHSQAFNDFMDNNTQLLNAYNKGGMGGLLTEAATEIWSSAPAALTSAITILDGATSLSVSNESFLGSGVTAPPIVIQVSNPLDALLTTIDIVSSYVLGSPTNTSSNLSASQIENADQAVLQHEVPWEPMDQSAEDPTAIQDIVNSTEAQFNVYPVIQVIKLALGVNPTAAQLSGWVPFVESNGLIQGQAQTNLLMDQMATAFVASDNFGKVYNNGVDVDPNSLATAQEMQVIIQAATGIASTPTQVNAWLALGLTIDQVFVDFALGDQYTAFSKAAIQQYLTTAADTAAGLQVTGTSFVLTPGKDQVTGTNLAIQGVLTGVAATTTLNVGDLINPTGNNNSMLITDTAGGLFNSANLPTFNNVQAIVVTDVAPSNDTFTLTGIAPAATTLGIQGGANNTIFQLFDGATTNTFTVTNVVGDGADVDFNPKPGLTSGGKANGSATIILNNVTDSSGGLGKGIALVGQAANDGFATVTLDSTGPVANEFANLDVVDGGFNDILKTLNVTGAAALKIDVSVFFAGGNANIQAGTDTGGLNITVDANGGSVVFVGGSGVDSLTVNELRLDNPATTLNGGTGTSNVLRLDQLTGASLSAADYTALTTPTVVTGFSILGLVGPGGATIAVNDGAGGLAGTFSHFRLVSSDNFNVTALPNNAVVDVYGNTTAFDTLAPGTGANTIAVNIGKSTSTGLADDLFLTGWTTISLTSNGDGTSTHVVQTHNSDAATFNISGSNALALTVGNAITTGDLINAASLTGTFTVQDSGKNDIINTGSGTTKITELPTTLGDLITYLSGHTTVDTLVSAADNNGGSNHQDVVTAFVLNQDVLKSALGALAQGTTADMAGVVNGTGLVGSGAFATSAAFITAAEATNTETAGHVIGAVIGNDTWIAEFFASTKANSAHIVELVGVTNETSISTVAGAGVITIA